MAHQSARVIWKRAYSETRRRGATGREVAAIICDSMGEPWGQATFWGERGPMALAMQRGLVQARRPVRPPFQSLAETVLNRFGTKNPWGASVAYGSRAWTISERARILRDRLAEQGRLILDHGGWVRGVRLGGATGRTI